MRASWNLSGAYFDAPWSLRIASGGAVESPSNVLGVLNCHIVFWGVLRAMILHFWMLVVSFWCSCVQQSFGISNWVRVMLKPNTLMLLMASFENNSLDVCEDVINTKTHLILAAMVGSVSGSCWDQQQWSCYGRPWHIELDVCEHVIKTLSYHTFGDEMWFKGGCYVEANNSDGTTDIIDTLY